MGLNIYNLPLLLFLGILILYAEEFRLLNRFITGVLL